MTVTVLAASFFRSCMSLQEMIAKAINTASVRRIFFKTKPTQTVFCNKNIYKCGGKTKPPACDGWPKLLLVLFLNYECKYSMIASWIVVNTLRSSSSSSSNSVTRKPLRSVQKLVLGTTQIPFAPKR